MTFRLTMQCDTAAFDDVEAEIARILRRVAADVAEQGDRDGACLDVNGNVVGTFALTGRMVKASA